jgi:hypothetical protein
MYGLLEDGSAVKIAQWLIERMSKKKARLVAEAVLRNTSATKADS